MARFPNRLSLPQVTLCAASSVNVAATLRALEVSLEQIEFAACKLFTDVPVKPNNPAIEVQPIGRLSSSRDYGDFVLTKMVDWIDTPYCLVAQWDGHVIDASHWRPEFLDFDYIGASWPQFGDGHDVGNGGFSLRSRRLMRLCRDPKFQPHRLEDVAIGRVNRVFLEESGMRFAPRALADAFSAERAGNVSQSFGYHGAWLMPQAIGVDPFWTVYRDQLDDRRTIRHDFEIVLKQMITGRGGWKRALHLSVDQAIHFGRR